MAISFVSNSAVAAVASGDLTLTPPTTQSDDIMVCAGMARDTVTVAFPTDWTLVQSNNGTINSWIAWKRCVSDESGNNVTVTHTGGAQALSRIALYRGCAYGNPTAGAATITSNGAATRSVATVTVTDPGAFVVFTQAINANITGFSNFRITNTQGNGVCLERFLRNGEKTGTGGNTICLGLADAAVPHPMNGTLSATISASAASLAGVLVLRPRYEIIMHSNSLAILNGKLVVGNM